jgi:hypothetical protein
MVSVPLGSYGIYSDDAQPLIPPPGFLRAENVELKNGFVEKATGSRRWNQNALPGGGVASFFDWWPDEHTQRVIAVTNDGRVWRFTDPYNFTEVKPAIESPVTNEAPANLIVTIPPVFLACGQELAYNPRKLFIMTGNSPIQVIAGDGTTRTNLSLPALDWTGAFQPYFALSFLSRVWAFGNQNFPHQMYASSVTNHEDFQTLADTLVVPVYPGDSERLVTANVFKMQLMAFKHPFGGYFINTDNPAAPIPQKLFDSFGAASQTSSIQVIDDLWVGNTAGTISSLTATNALGGLQQQDVIKNMKCFKYIEENTNPLSGSDQRALWYEAKKLAYFTYHSPSGLHPDRIFVIDFQSGQPRPSFSNKDQPSCMALVKDISLVQRPFYGSIDGYIYQMDQEDRNVGGNGENNTGGSAYTMNFQTSYMDFSFVNPAYAEITKNFDFMEVTFEPTGNWPIYADVFLDNVFIETIQFTLAQSDLLDQGTAPSATSATGAFTLDKSRLGGPGLRSIRRPMHGQGRRVSVRFYQPDFNHNVMISSMTFYFRLSGQQQRSA